MKSQKKRNKTGKERQTLHLKKRFRQRYGIEISDSDVHRMCKQIQNMEAKLIERSTHTRAIYNVEHNNETYVVVYSKATKTLITVLYPEML